MKRTLYLHIGLTKTGSSSIQSWLSAASAALEAQGVRHADLHPDAKHGRIASGNARHFLDYIIEGRRRQAPSESDFRTAIREIYFGELTKSIVSSETLSAAKPQGIEKLRLALDTDGVEVKVVAFVRSVYDHCWSAYHQQVKRGGYFGTFAEFAETYSNRQIRALQHWSAVFDGLTVINYDTVKRDIVAAFCKACRIEQAPGSLPQGSYVNRSLTGFELGLLTALNRIAHDHDISLAQSVSDAVIYLDPQQKACFSYEPAVVQRLEQRFAKDVAWVNEKFLTETPLSIDTAGERASRDMDSVSLNPAYIAAVEAFANRLTLPGAKSTAKI